MQGSDLPAGRSAELYVRSLLPDGYYSSQERVIDRASGLVEAGALAEQRIHVWGSQAPAAEADTRTAVGEHVLDRVTVFREWAAINGCSLSPAFEVREVDDGFTDEQYRVVRFPAVLLAEFRGDALVCVTPHAADSEVVTVSDRLAALDADEQTRFEPLDEAATEAAPTRVQRPRSEPGDGEEALPIE